MVLVDGVVVLMSEKSWSGVGGLGRGGGGGHAVEVGSCCMIG